MTPGQRQGAVLAAAAALAAALVLYLVHAGARGAWLALPVAAPAVLAWFGMARLARGGGIGAAAVPALFGAWVLYLWEAAVVGFEVPRVLLPPPSSIGRALAGSAPVLAADWVQTFVRSVLPGWLMGCAAGLAVAVLADRSAFLKNGLLPLGNLVSALPVVGVAPIMVMWFGFDWPSKAAVVVLMTFFPMLVNALAGLASAGRLELDLMRTYGATAGQTLRLLRLPAALPFVFNALKVNASLALIGAIVAEFFGTPIVGMGFRISTEVGRLNLELVWATIAVAAVTGSLFHALLSLAERALTSWHPSFRAAA